MSVGYLSAIYICTCLLCVGPYCPEICSTLMIGCLVFDRRILATTPFMLLHDKQKQSGLSLSATPECAHIFLHPLTWMRPSLFPGSTPAASSDVSSMSTADSQSEDTPLSGRLTCPNPACGSNVGKFSWPGMQCSCGRWIVPAIGVARSKVDVIEKIDVGAIGIRLPANMR
jgi:dual specificity phosphatase 12